MDINYTIIRARLFLVPVGGSKTLELPGVLNQWFAVELSVATMPPHGAKAGNQKKSPPCRADLNRIDCM